MFSQTMTEDEVNRCGAASELRYFHTTYGQTFGYNERARKYHRSYGLVTPPTNPAFVDYQLGDLATAPLYRRDHLGFRVDYPDKEFTWSESANKLKKNQKRYGGEDEDLKSSSSSSTMGPLPPRTVQFYQTELQRQEAAMTEEACPSDRPDPRELARRQQEFEADYAAHQTQLAKEAKIRTVQESDAAQQRAILTSSLSPSRHMSPTARGANPQSQEYDFLNRNLYPQPGFKNSDINPQFNAPTR